MLVCVSCLQLENEEEEELITAVADGLTQVLCAYGDAALPLLDGIMSEIAVLLRPEASVEEKRIGVCIMDDVLEYSEQGQPSCVCMPKTPQSAATVVLGDLDCTAGLTA